MRVLRRSLTVILLLCIVPVVYVAGNKNLLASLPILQSSYPKTDQDWINMAMAKAPYYCQKNQPYPIKPEFSRAISLFVQRFGKNIDLSNRTNTDYTSLIAYNQNCLDIDYTPTEGQMNGAEGLFLFDPKESGRTRLRILVSPSYIAQDDLVTSILLSHELFHVAQYIAEDNITRIIGECKPMIYKKDCPKLEQMSCVDNEVYAFSNSLIYFSSLKQSEKDSYFLRAKEGMQNKLHRLIYDQVMGWGEWAGKCNSQLGNTERWTSCLSEVIRQDIVSNPYYKKQCGI